MAVNDLYIGKVQSEHSPSTGGTVPDCMLQAWKQGTHIPEVAQERLVCMLCSVMIELMIPKIVVQPYWIAIAMLYTVWTKTL